MEIASLSFAMTQKICHPEQNEGSILSKAKAEMLHCDQHDKRINKPKFKHCNCKALFD